MYQQIKEMAEKALALQNKDVMDETLRNISECCTQLMDSDKLASAPGGFGASSYIAGQSVATGEAVTIKDGVVVPYLDKHEKQAKAKKGGAK